MILVIQTVRPEIEVMLFDQKLNLVAGRNWLSNRDEVARLLPEIEKLLAENGGLSEIDRILVFNGIGGFASTRIGVTVANTLALITKADLFEISCKEEVEGEESDTAELVKSFLEVNPLPVKISQPKYKSAPMISESKKKKFN